MKSTVTAVVVSHDSPEYLAVTLEALANQTVAPDEIVIVDTSSKSDSAEFVKLEYSADVLRLDPKTKLHASIAAALDPEDNGWIWLLHDDSAPEPDALEKLLASVELAPSVAIAGPKQLQWQQPRVIMQMGLTLTRGWTPFSAISGELDQSQHDDESDVLAVGTAGALIRADVYRQLGGLDAGAPPLAADLDLSIRARLTGHRVVVVPEAKVRHRGLSLAGERPRSWLRTSPHTAMLRAAVHLRLVFSPLPIALLYWLFLPAIGVIRVAARLLAKRPDRIFGEISSTLWGFFTIAARLRSRGRPGTKGIGELKPLRATRRQVKANARAKFEQEEAIANLEAFRRGELHLLERREQKSFFASGGIWWIAAIAVASFRFLPRGVAVVGGGLYPLGSNWLDLFVRTGSSWLPLGGGFAAPSDPFNWVLLTLGTITPWQPTLALTVFVWLAPALAFMTSWQFVGLVSARPWVRSLSALAYALGFAVLESQAIGQLPSLVSAVLLPIFGVAIARAAGFGRYFSSRATQQTWSWVALAALLFAFVGSATPSLIPALLLALLWLAVIRPKRIGHLVWVPVPLIALFGPFFWYLAVGLGHPTAALADPGVALDSAPQGMWALLAQLRGVSISAVRALDLSSPASWLTVAPALLVLLAVLALLTRRFGSAAGAWLLAIILAIGATLFGQLRFIGYGIGTSSTAATVHGSQLGWYAALALILATAAAITMDASSKRKWLATLAGAALLASVVPGVLQATSPATNLSWGDGRTVPAILAASAEQGNDLRLLELTPVGGSASSLRLDAQVLPLTGVHLEDASTAYRFALAARSNGIEYPGLARLVARLASGNTAGISQALDAQHVGYVLIPKPTQKVSAISSAADRLLAASRQNFVNSLNSSNRLEAVGSTEFGDLWRVIGVHPVAVDHSSEKLWSVTKGIQLGVIGAFLLLAIPTSSIRRRSQKGSAIFDDITNQDGDA
jgi:GT2 family glycosyltransferase